MTGGVWVAAPLLAYFGLLLGIALVRSRRMNNMSDYVLGGRRLGSFTTALSAGSSTTSAWTMLALPGLAFSGGLVEIWIPVGAVVGIGLSWTLLAGRLRRFTIAANDALTIPEFYSVRFGDRSGILRTLTSLLTIVFVVFYVSSGLIGGSKLLETIFGIEAGIGIVLTLLAVASYTLDRRVPGGIADRRFPGAADALRPVADYGRAGRSRGGQRDRAGRFKPGIL